MNAALDPAVVAFAAAVEEESGEMLVVAGRYSSARTMLLRRRRHLSVVQFAVLRALTSPRSRPRLYEMECCSG